MANTVFKRNEVLVLLGAGASVEAGVPDSTAMVSWIEDAVVHDTDWKDFRSLYWYIRSAIYYADGLRGVIGSGVTFNIERLVDALDELHKKERHTLYPFVGAWNPKLLDVAGNDFDTVRAFRTRIVEVLRGKWLDLPRREKASYYQGLLRFQAEYEYPLRVFSLNYDLCVEHTCGFDTVQRGFDGRQWDWRMFDENSGDRARVLLYKLHGSTDWKMSGGRVTYVDAPGHIPQEEAALIFGTTYKLQYVDPFLFLAYELRRWTLDEARVIITIGYGFGDEHINGILQQALRQDPSRKLLAVTQAGSAEFVKEKEERIVSTLDVTSEQVIVDASGAKEFLLNRMSIPLLAGLFPPDPDLIPELNG